MCLNNIQRRDLTPPLDFLNSQSISYKIVIKGIIYFIFINRKHYALLNLLLKTQVMNKNINFQGSEGKLVGYGDPGT